MSIFHIMKMANIALEETLFSLLNSVNPRPTGGGYFEPPPLSFSCDIF